MKNFINYIKESIEDEYDKTFLKLAHLDELEIQFDFISHKITIINKNYIFYFYNNKKLFRYNKKRKEFDLCQYNFFEKLDTNYTTTIKIYTPILQKYFRLNILDVSSFIDIM